MELPDTNGARMENVVIFPGAHARASTGQRSGLNSLRETPVSRSIAETNSAGTPRFDLTSQYQTCDCVVPIRSAKAFCPPTASHARLSASVLIEPRYTYFGRKQQKTLWGTNNLSFGTFHPMKQVNPLEFGERVRELRKELEWSQDKLAKLAGYKQQTITWVETGKAGDPRKQVLRLADALGTTAEWLLYGTGERKTQIRVLPPEEVRAMYEEFPFSVQELITKVILEHRSTGEPIKRLKTK